jgi:protocatechuate 3,4-dioxygenase beta subunit
MLAMLLSALFLIASPAQNTPPLTEKPVEKCRIEGVVLNAATGAPIPRVTVSLQGDKRVSGWKSVTSDAGGHFEVTNIEPGRYSLSAHKNGFIESYYGQRTPGGHGTPLALTAGQQVRDICLRLTPAAAVTGRVSDEYGEAVQGVEVLALLSDTAQGKPSSPGTAGSSAMTDDQGQYRLFGLAPGRYLVRVSCGLASVDKTCGQVFYPGTTDSGQASFITLRGGDEYPGVDFTVQMQKGVSVRGRVQSLLGSQAEHARVMVISRDEQGSRVRGAAVNGPDGSFELPNLAPGSYELQTTIEANGKLYTTRQPLEVGDTDIEGVVLTVGAGVTLKGRVSVEGQPKLSLSSLQVALPTGESFVGFMPAAYVSSDGSFTIGNISPGTYHLRLQPLPEGVYIKSARLGSEDVLDSGLDIGHGQPAGLEIVLGCNAGQVEGVVLKDQQAYMGATVVLIPNPPRRRRHELFKTAGTDQSGRFLFRSVVPGDYQVFAWEEVAGGSYYNSDYIKNYEGRGQPVHVTEGAHLLVQLDLIPAKDSNP